MRAIKRNGEQISCAHAVAPVARYRYIGFSSRTRVVSAVFVATMRSRGSRFEMAGFRLNVRRDNRAAIGFTRAYCVQSGFELLLVNTHGHRVHMSNCTVKYAARRGEVGLGRFELAGVESMRRLLTGF
jgi:hypothetical protein